MIHMGQLNLFLKKIVFQNFRGYLFLQIEQCRVFGGYLILQNHSHSRKSAKLSTDENFYSSYSYIREVHPTKYGYWEDQGRKTSITDFQTFLLLAFVSNLENRFLLRY